MSDREIKVVISATDAYSAQLNRFNTAIGGMGTAVGRAEASTAGLESAFNSLSVAWMRVGAVIAASAWFVSATKKAGEAEEAYNKLRLQVEALGLSYDGQRQSIEGAINAASKYAIVQDEDVAAVLQQMIFHSGNYAASLENLNLVYDLAYLKNISAAEAATIVGKAITGNIEGLGRLFPELKDVNERLGEHATKSEKAAYSLQFFTEKVKGSRGEMTQYTRDVAEITAAYEVLHQTVGKFTARGLANTIDAVKNLRFLPLVDEAAAIDRAAHAINKNNVVVTAATNGYKKGNDAVMEMVASRGKSLAMLEKETKAASDDAEAKKKAAELLKKTIASAAKTEADNYRNAAAKIIEVEAATERLTASKARMIEISAIEFASEGANTQQLEAYITALKKLQAKKDEIAAKKEEDTAGEKLKGLLEASPYATMSSDREDKTALEQENEARLKTLNKYHADVLTQKALSGATELELEQMNERLITEMKKTEGDLRLARIMENGDLEIYYNKRKYLLMTAAQGSAFGQMSANLNYLYTESGSKYRLMFEAAKAFAISQTIINTYKDAIAGAAALSGIPVVGPALAMAYKATAIATGMMAVKKIMDTNPGTSAAGSLGSSGYGGGSPYAGSPTPEALSSREDTKPTQHITFIINSPLSQQNWEKIAQDNIIPAINAAGDRNVKISLNAVEAN